MKKATDVWQVCGEKSNGKECTLKTSTYVYTGAFVVINKLISLIKI
jgi:hypothetical protein